MERVHEAVAIVGSIDPDAHTAATYLTDAIDCSDFDQLLFIVQAGTLGASATLDFKVTASATSGGSYTDITGAAITQLTKAGSDDSKMSLISLDVSHVLSAGKRYVKGSMTIGTATSDAGVIVLGYRPHYAPATTYDLADVDEIVVK